MTNLKEMDKNSSMDDILEGYPREQRFTLAIMQDIQEKYHYLPRESLNAAAEYLDVSISKLYSMATFYKAFSLKARGENIIKVCDGTACHIRSSAVLLDEIERLLGIKPGDTTDDGTFSLETVNCLGSCALAPAMMVNKDYYGSVTQTMIGKILEQYGGNSHEQ